jgi:hypothetical protein
MVKYKVFSTTSYSHIWDIEAPAGLNSDDIDELLKCLCDYSDSPSQEALRDMLVDEDWMKDLIIDAEKIPLLESVIVNTEIFDREVSPLTIKEK